MKYTEEKIYQNNGNILVQREVSKVKGSTLLDIGCGGGANARHWTRGGLLVDGLTLSEIERAACQTTCRKVFVADLDIGLPALEEKYDIIVCSHVLEHLARPERLLKDIAQNALKDSGQIVIALPNFLFLRHRIQLLLGDFEYEPEGLRDITHLRWFTVESARKTIEESGFTILDASFEGWVPLGPVRRLLPRRWTKGFDQYATMLFPGLLSYQFVFRCRARLKN
jgi:2-polyprenyl-3-methyl-5-hydroxy-6-metoxy-1,4-benzoquinol methylase